MEPIPYRIRIGVTGHRVLDNETELKKQLIEVLKTEIIKLFDNDSLTLLYKNLITPVTYSIVTPLAEGADRLVAETVMEYDTMSCIEVVLPLTLSDYKKTFNMRKHPYWDYYTPETKKLVADAHQKEIDFFGYSFRKKFFQISNLFWDKC